MGIVGNWIGPTLRATPLQTDRVLRRLSRLGVESSGGHGPCVAANSSIKTLKYKI